MPIEPVDLSNEKISDKKSPSSVVVMMELIKSIKDLTEEIKSLSDRVKLVEDKVARPATMGIRTMPAQPITQPYTWNDTNGITSTSYTAAQMATEGTPYYLDVSSDFLTSGAMTPASRTVSYTIPPASQEVEEAVREIPTRDFSSVLNRLNILERSYEDRIRESLYEGLDEDELNILAEVLDPNS